ncbi:MAG: UDP-galactopyranose mutase [Massiliimalia sp.]|jgi:UDP-galactopyranose mutase
MKYDYLIVGAGLFGSVFAREAADRGYHCMVIEKRDHIGGNLYCRDVQGIRVHQYGPHIFHTNLPQVWEYVNRFVSFNRFTYSPLANYQGEIYNLPFNMNTFYQMWGTVTPAQAKQKLEEQTAPFAGKNPANLEEQALKLIGPDLYEKLVQGYTQKQWGRPCNQLPAFIIRRLPVRFSYDNNYFDHPWQGIPHGGYNRLIEALLDGVPVHLKTDYFQNRNHWDGIARKGVYTGPIDQFFEFQFGPLEYRSLRFETEVLDIPNYQGCAGVNFTGLEVPYTRIIEHKHFEFGTQPNTVITREYSAEWTPGQEPYYPVNDQKNQQLYERYAALAKEQNRVLFGGRLGEYRYYDMDMVIHSALRMAQKELTG